MTLSSHARGFTDRLAIPVGRGLVRLGVTADALTVTGLLLGVAGAAMVLTVDPLAGGLVLAVGALIDGLDGTVARLRGAESRLGGFFDSVADRMSEGVLFGVVAWMVRDDPAVLALALVAALMAQLTSYVRAKAESLGWDASGGVVERPERMLIIIPGIAFEIVPVALVILAVGTTLTVVQRVVAVRRQSRADASESA